MKEIREQTEREFIKTQNGMKIETITLLGKNQNNNQGEKHLIYFIGGNRALSPSKDYSQNWNWATEQGITVHLFNYPGLGLSKNTSLIRSNRVKSGIAVVTNLLEKGIKPDDIILFGDCLGGHVAAEVHKNFKYKDIHLRCIVSNAASSLKQASLYYFGFIAKLKIFLAPIIKLVLKIFGCHWKTYKIVNSITPYTMYFNREGDKTIKQPVQLATKIEKIEQSGRRKDYQKKEIFEDFEEYEGFFKQHTTLRKNDKCIDSKKADKDIHKLPITCLKSSNKTDYTFPELISLYIYITDEYFSKYGSLNNEEKIKAFKESKFYKDFSSCKNSKDFLHNYMKKQERPSMSFQHVIIESGEKKTFLNKSKKASCS
ncbi:alpha/beta hydrolase family protein [Wolbachia endosymbiont of Laodelphax striatellus]|uniref:alpha/beta hydrolase n=1 Tax=Wolbachia endosymbiont of Laodelphax striatellus TaxID=368602 RepID=UPI00117EB471|nr:alpha/beta hydrolase [Wolbachia endosymbiont of Laodelphax striatellus]